MVGVSSLSSCIDGSVDKSIPGQALGGILVVRSKQAVTCTALHRDGTPNCTPLVLDFCIVPGLEGNLKMQQLSDLGDLSWNLKCFV